MTGLELHRHATALVATLEQPEGADPETFAPELAAFLDGTTDRISAYRWALRAIDSSAAELRSIEATVASRRRYLEQQAARVTSLATMLLTDMEQLGEEPKVKRPEFSAWLATTESVTVADEAIALLPPTMLRVRTEPDKTAIKIALKAGAELPGCAILSTRGVRWR